MICVVKGDTVILKGYLFKNLVCLRPQHGREGREGEERRVGERSRKRERGGGGVRRK